MLYLTKTQTHLTCVPSQRSFMSLVWYTAKAMNKNAKGSKAYLKAATAFVQNWHKTACAGAIHTMLRPMIAKSQYMDDLTTLPHQCSVAEQSTSLNCLSHFYPKWFSASPLKTLTNLGFFSYPTTLFKTTY